LEWRDGTLVVVVEDEAKTGYREVFPFHPHWVDRWNLGQVRRPKVQPKWLKDYGDRCSKAFKREAVGFPPYTLRHAWCIRVSVRYRLPLSVAAALAGHSPTVHLNTYQRWISAAQHQEVYQQSIAAFKSALPVVAPADPGNAGGESSTEA
jgi:integrase